MANYNTFAVVESRHGKILLITSSARKASELLCVGNRIEVWNENDKVTSITYKTQSRLRAFIRIEKDFIRRKQEAATRKNKFKKEHKYGKQNNYHS